MKKYHHFHHIIKPGNLIAWAMITLLIGCKSIGTAKPIIDIESEITGGDIYDHIAYLAADELAGRYPGTAGSQKAAAYISETFKLIGLNSFAEFDGYYQGFNFTSMVEITGENYFTANGTALQLGTDYYPLPYSTEGSFSGAVVSVGYGFDIDTLEWHDYAGLDLADRWVLLIDGVPDSIANDIDIGKERLKQKVLAAKDMQIKGILVLAETAADGSRPLKRPFAREFRDSGVLVISITDPAADILLGKPGSVAELRKKAATAGGAASKEYPAVEADVAVHKKEINHEIHNVVGYVEGNDSLLNGQYIVVGAHYDHLGYGGVGSGSTAPDTHAVHNGADDNASGVSAMLELAHKFATEGTPRSVIFIAFNGEEQGLLGSKYFTENLPIDKDSIALMINIDMIGRLRDDQLTVGGTGTAPIFERVLPEFNRSYQFKLNMMPDGPGPGDHSSFYYIDVPVLFAFTGAHEDYHKPSDDLVGIDTVGVQKVAAFMYDVADYFSQRPARPEFTASAMASNTSSRRSFRVTFGVIPAHGSTVDGMGLDGVKEGGPAGNAGLLRGDIIIGINGHEIHNIQDYMYRLSALKKGAAVQVKVNRSGEVLEFTLNL